MVTTTRNKHKQMKEAEEAAVHHHNLLLELKNKHCFSSDSDNSSSFEADLNAIIDLKQEESQKPSTNKVIKKFHYYTSM